jgi:branched-chain amino acid transport system permease protein
MPTLVFILAMVIVGGLRSTWGLIFGAMAMMLLVEVAKGMGDVRNTVVGVVLVLFVLLLPKGIAGGTVGAIRALHQKLRGPKEKQSQAHPTVVQTESAH